VEKKTYIHTYIHYRDFFFLGCAGRVGGRGEGRGIYWSSTDRGYPVERNRFTNTVRWGFLVDTFLFFLGDFFGIFGDQRMNGMGWDNYGNTGDWGELGTVYTTEMKKGRRIYPGFRKKKKKKKRKRQKS